jgi:hypothetical protein
VFHPAWRPAAAQVHVTPQVALEALRTPPGAEVTIRGLHAEVWELWVPELVPIVAAALAEARPLPLLAAFDETGVPYTTRETEPGTLIVAVAGTGPVAVVTLEGEPLTG